jgi:hypothetical protein
MKLFIGLDKEENEIISFNTSNETEKRKNKRLPNDSLFNLNQLNLINQKLTRTVSQMICLKYFLQFNDANLICFSPNVSKNFLLQRYYFLLIIINFVKSLA